VLNINLVDTHAHLDMPEFDNDREAVIERARDSGLKYIITIGINPESNQRAIALAQRYPFVYAGLGIHPHDSKGVNEQDIERLIEMAAHPKVVAIGEMGLDFFREGSPRNDQMQVFQWQLNAVKKIAKPIVIHCRQAQTEILPVLKAWRNEFNLPEDRPPGVLHCFNLDARSAQPYLDMGFYLSVGAYIGYPSSAALRETIKSIPLECIMIETDCPFLPPQKMRGQRNEPVYSLITAGILAELKGLTVEELCNRTTANARRMFQLK
jgi:TatD DNase family protein